VSHTLEVTPKSHVTHITRNSNTPVCDEFFYVFYGTHKKLVVILWVPKILIGRSICQGGY